MVPALAESLQDQFRGPSRKANATSAESFPQKVAIASL